MASFVGGGGGPFPVEPDELKATQYARPSWRLLHWLLISGFHVVISVKVILKFFSMTLQVSPETMV